MTRIPLNLSSIPPPFSEAPAQRARPGCRRLPCAESHNCNISSYHHCSQFYPITSPTVSHFHAQHVYQYSILLIVFHGGDNSSGLCHFCHRSLQILMLLLLYLRSSGVTVVQYMRVYKSWNTDVNEMMHTNQQLAIPLVHQFYSPIKRRPIGAAVLRTSI